MAATTEIAWTDATFNPWIGCAKVAPGCEHCYAEAFAKRYGKATWGPHGTRVKTSEIYWRQPLKWNRAAEKEGVRRRVFCASLADVFEDWEGPIHDSKGCELWEQLSDRGKCKAVTMTDLRCELFALIDATPWLDWQLLTKRPENVLKMWPLPLNGEEPLSHRYLIRPNVWIGTSVATQADADKNIPELLECRDLARVLFVSAEPLLGEVNLEANRMGVGPWHDEPWLGGIDWVIIGGESGHHARPCNIDWVRGLRDQCRAASVSCFIKQLGANIHAQGPDRNTAAVGLRDKKGGDWLEWPEDLRVREFPEVESINA